MKAVLISIRPKWCELIASGKKTVEVRKSKPKLETPFKVYIYMTMDKCPQFVYDEKLEKQSVFERAQNLANGRVIGEFVCDDIIVDERGENADILRFYGNLTHAELLEYGKNKTLYGWHISDLVIYDEPKELSEFYAEGECTVGKKCEKCAWLKFETETRAICTLEEDYKPITRPPQSWCYVEEHQNAEGH